MSVAADLTELHRLHSALKEIREDLSRGPRQLKIRDQVITNAKNEVTSKQEELKQTRLAADRKGLELKTLEAKLVDLRGKLNQAASNREYDILRGQIEADGAAKAVMEDEILDYLDRIDRLQKEIVIAHERVGQAEADKKSYSAQFAAEEPVLKQKEADLVGRMATAEKVLTGETLSQYRRVVDAHGAEAMAPVENGVCTGCYVALRPQQRVQLNNGVLLFCSSCGRLLYLSE
ncbi:Putative zinc ribbon domain protein [Caulifigura coniformis]|uniref:Zinc ribbon domain protein n=1 Tax=Caulifigura coniformis TaxID=2527983 RepID=A0A517SMN8_9PLAN|nr:C4-type zinc ribbon domain-containing protein [Caulifigura coniformis]QDT57378.1 Putative zinc ribbon domain protein [Caulifigura coniformis]